MPAATSSEYLRNYGVANSGAMTAWNAGATGTGITVGVIDSGVQTDQADLAGRLSPLSTDIVAGRNTPSGTDNHATFVAGVIGAGFNGFGTVGVAYNSTILSIRADISDCTDPDDTTCFRSTDLARAIDYAVANGAKVINLSIGGETPLGSAFEAAMLRAVNAGLVFAISSGNESGADPEYPGRYATDPRFAGAVIVVGAHDSSNLIASFSNRAGVSANDFLSAAGVDIISGCNGTTCLRGSGTSFSAPAVAGALALLLEAFPNLTGRQAVDLLLRTARDAGAAGTDVVYGRGLLDIARAFAPVGTTSTPSAAGAPVTVAETPGAFIGGAFGDALTRTSALQSIVHDEYDRLFRADIAAFYPTAPRRNLQPDTAPATQSARLAFAMPDGTSLNLVAVTEIAEPEPVVARISPFEAPWLGAEPRSEAMLSLTAGRYRFSAWQGEGGARSPFRSGSSDGFAALANADHAIKGGVTLGALTFSAETGGGDRTSLLRPVERDASTYSRAALAWRGARGTLHASVGALDERMGPLGAYMPLGSDLALPTRTAFGGLGGDYRLSRRVWLSGEAGLGRSELEGRFLSLDRAAISSMWRASLTADCGSWAAWCSSLTWEVSQPLRIESGTFAARLADAPLEYFDETTFSTRRFSAAPSGREIDFAIRSRHLLDDGSALRLEAIAIRQEQHRRDAPPGFALLAGWAKRF
ncbi:hypothetical protein BH09PSE1_BH09PSE1_07220 [soil metagenome]